LRFESGFPSAIPADHVYNAMLDVPSVAGCLPGASVEGCDPQGRYRAAITVRAGPMRLGYDGTVEIVERDDAARSAIFRAEGREQRGLGSAAATVALRVDPAGAGCGVTIAIDLAVTDRVARLGQGILQPLATSMVERFGVCLERRLSEPDGGAIVAEPDEAHVSQLFKAMWTKIRHPHHHHGEA
jgi:carbon monoxide dehydrogenase subunit G